MARKLRPLYDKVLVKRVEGQDTTKGGIIIPDSAKEKPLEGEILAVGKGKLLSDGKLRAPMVKVGDRVLFAKWAETEIKIDGETALLLKEEDLLGVLEK